MSYATHCIPWDEACSICNPGSGSEPPANPDADDVCSGGCPFGLPAGHRIKDHPVYPGWRNESGTWVPEVQPRPSKSDSGSPPVGPLQALREALEKLGEYPEQDSEEYAAFRQAKAALESVEEQLAALQRERLELIHTLEARETLIETLRSQNAQLRWGHQSLMDQTVRIRRMAGVPEGADGDTEEHVRRLAVELEELRARGSSPSSPKGDA